ncbi:hypothetical protein [Lacticaseibacillus hulanensis]|uniref:hypothetical protein n=1 Tax=Lacticaseibacillus hulanensis TaxID=2493111 RepID=UPI000FDB1789|nr:hypothetical protein [Lacticaseibacillus hulanensis]
MNDIFNYQHLINRMELSMLVIMAIFGNAELFIISAVFIAIFLAVKVGMTEQYARGLKFVLALAYLGILVLQIVFFVNVINSGFGYRAVLVRMVAAVVLPAPFLVEFIVTRSNNDRFYLPKLGQVATISFAEFKKNEARLRQAMAGADRVKSILSLDNVKDIMADLHRHSAVRYVNEGSLDAGYFNRAEESLADPSLYIVISNTGSPASELISLFTQKQFNHASLSFDSDLTTIISYNGGERVYPPGLNPEMVEAFHKKPDASVLVYRLPVTQTQKQCVIDTIRQINLTGSAYNILGLVTKRSLRTNIMFCSQFVYRMLQVAGVDYFQKKPGDVRPTDFVELDYKRKLQFVTEIKF